MTRLTLASQSPRRAKILADLGVAFDVVKTNAPEVSMPHDPEGTVLANARAKLLACGRAPALAADTIVWFAGKIYGKPRDLAEAKAFLRELSGNTHIVFTGIAYHPSPLTHHPSPSPSPSPSPFTLHPSPFTLHLSPPLTACARSEVHFRALSDATIDEYIARVRPLDRAGAYDIDESGDLIVDSYTGEYENIMGLPVEPLRRFGII
jgi:septum formation protein